MKDIIEKIMELNKKNRKYCNENNFFLWIWRETEFKWI